MNTLSTRTYHQDPFYINVLYRSRESHRQNVPLCEECTSESICLPLNRDGAAFSGKMRRGVCHEVCIKTKKEERNVWVHSLACLYLLRYVKPDASIIQSTALRRSPTRDTLLRVTCAHDTTTAMYTRVCTATRMVEERTGTCAPAPGYPG